MVIKTNGNSAIWKEFFLRMGRQGCFLKPNPDRFSVVSEKNLFEYQKQFDWEEPYIRGIAVEATIFANVEKASG